MLCNKSEGLHRHSMVPHLLIYSPKSDWMPRPVFWCWQAFSGTEVKDVSDRKSWVVLHHMVAKKGKNLSPTYLLNKNITFVGNREENRYVFKNQFDVFLQKFPMMGYVGHFQSTNFQCRLTFVTFPKKYPIC